MHSLDEILRKQGVLSISSHGETVHRDIQETIREASSGSRWFWELLQNAKDAVEKDEQVSIQLLLTKEKLEFSHTGNRFKLDEILKLIIQGTTKSGKEKGGRFGTGFISTYILSLEVNIRGRLDDGTTFNFLLDRRANDPSEFLKKQEECTKNFYHSFNTDLNQQEEFQTQFSYTLNEITFKIAEEGLLKIDELLPFVLAFNPKLKKVIIQTESSSITYEKIQIQKHYEYELPILEIIIGCSSSEQQISVLMIEGGNWNSAIKVINTDKGRKIVSQENFPNLFVSFPLLGTEILGLPVAIHSDSFDVKEGRDGIFLGENELETGNSNKQIVSSGISSISPLLKWCVLNKIENIFNLINFLPNKEANWLDSKWLAKSNLCTVKQIEEIACITPYQNKGTPISIKDVLIPADESIEKRLGLWELLKEFHPENIPEKESIEQWFQLAGNYSTLLSSKEGEKYFQFTIENLCEQIGQKQNLETLQKCLRSIGVIDWLNKLYLFIGTEKIHLFYNYAIIPNQKGELIKATSNLKIDAFKDDVLKEIYSLIGKDILENLVINGIELPNGVSTELKQQDVLNTLTGEIMTATPIAYEKPEMRQANAGFLKWLIDNKENERLKTFQVIVRGEDKSKKLVFFKISFDSEKKPKILSPKSKWCTSYPLYSELVSEKNCLHEVYAEILSDENYDYLEKNGFIYLTPLILKREKPTAVVLRQLLKDVNDESYFYNDKGENFSVLEYSDFAFFTTSEENVLANNSTASSALKILKFALKEAAIIDTSYDQFQQIEVNGKKIELHKALWVGRLKINHWVYTKSNLHEELKGKEYLAEKPNSRNLAALLKEQQDLKSIIREEKASRLLNLLEISVSDLIKNTLNNEQEKDAWERTFTALLTSGIEPSLAETMLNDSNLRNEYQKRRDREKIIHRNQAIGKAMEDCFRQLLEEEEFVNLGWKIERVPWGSDFVISDETSDLVNANNQEEGFKIGKWFIELKATAKSFAAMTPLQAKRAVENKDHYALVILPLDGSDITSESIRSKAYFVSTIGSILEEKYNAVQDLQNKKEKVVQTGQDVEISIVSDELRYHIKSSLWEKNKNLEGFKEYLLGKPVVL